MTDDELLVEAAKTLLSRGLVPDWQEMLRLIELADIGLSGRVETSFEPTDAGVVMRLSAWQYHSAGRVFIAYCDASGCSYNSGKRTRARDAMRSVCEHLRDKHELDIGFPIDRSPVVPRAGEQ